VDRYQRQKLLPAMGTAGQARLSRARVLLVGCGALGTVIAEQLVRAGVGFLRICDRDVVELSNLQRQVLFDEAQAEAGAPKAIAARDRLVKINAEVVIEPHVVDVHCGNIESLMRARGGLVDLILDGTDNAQTRYLINDAAVKLRVPWVYGACVGTTGRMMGIRPGQSACLRCLFPEPPCAGELPTCDTAGVLSAAAGVIASLQIAEAIKLLLDDSAAARELVTIDVWNLHLRAISTMDARRADCPACGKMNFEFLSARAGALATSLCGRNTVQVRPPDRAQFDLKTIAARLGQTGPIVENPFFVRCNLPERSGLVLTVFRDGRALVHGTADAGIAQSVYAQYVGT
jgi:adenylyltransferase/sulfurtransferase